MLEFKTDPFYLYPVEIDQLDVLFINREDEVKLAESVFENTYENPKEAIAILGDIGIGKSSTLNYIYRLADQRDYKVGSYTAEDDYISDDIYKDNEVVIIDDIDKISDDEANTFYRKLEKFVRKCGVIFFSDRYNRENDAIALRNSSITQKIPLPRGMGKEKLKLFLEERMKRCSKGDTEFKFPFTDDSIEIASIRTSNNLRDFIRYSKSAWRLKNDEDMVYSEDMKKSIIMEDRSFLGRLDISDLKILWYSTTGEFNIGYLAEICELSRPTVKSRIRKNLSDVITQKRSGKKIIVTSLYKKLPEGKNMLKEMLNSMDVSLEEIIDR